MGTQKGRLFELAGMYRSYRRKITKDETGKKKSPTKDTGVQSVHFDDGNTISLTYNFEMHPETLHETHERHADAMSNWDSRQSEAFYIEAFDAEETVEVPYHEVESAGDDKRIERIVTGFSKDSDPMEGMEEDEEQLDEMEDRIDSILAKDDDRSEAMDTEIHEGADEEEANSGSERISIDNVHDKGPEKDDSKQKNSGDVGAFSYDATDEEFARDIGAILQGQKVYDGEQKKAVGREVPAAAPRAPQKADNTADQVIDPLKNEHRIFEKIAQSMTYANSYDLGAIALEEKFQLLDQELEKEDVNKVLRHSPAGELNDTDSVLADPEDDRESAGVAMNLPGEKFNHNSPLTPGNGGRLIGITDLLPGDLILELDASGGAVVAGVYSGGGKVVSAVEGGRIKERQVGSLMGSRGTPAVLRHKKMQADKAALITEGLTKLSGIDSKLQPPSFQTVKIPNVSLHEDVCHAAGEEEKSRCTLFNGRIHLGTQTNDGFLCPVAIIDAFGKNQLPFLSAASNDHNGTLQYFGHLKHL